MRIGAALTLHMGRPLAPEPHGALAPQAGMATLCGCGATTTPDTRKRFLPWVRGQPLEDSKHSSLCGLQIPTRATIELPSRCPGRSNALRPSLGKDGSHPCAIQPLPVLPTAHEDARSRACVDKRAPRSHGAGSASLAPARLMAKEMSTVTMVPADAGAGCWPMARDRLGMGARRSNPTILRSAPTTPRPVSTLELVGSHSKKPRVSPHNAIGSVSAGDALGGPVAAMRTNYTERTICADAMNFDDRMACTGPMACIFA